MMSVVEEISRMSKVGCSNKELLDYTYGNCDEIECELNGNEKKNPKSTIMIFALIATWK